MDRGVGAAARLLPESDRKDLAIQALAGSETVSDLAARHGVSRKFVYQQTHKARAALDEAFSSATPDEAVLFELAVTKTWLRQVIVALPLLCRSSYRGVVEFLRDLLGLPVSLGHVHDVLQAVTRQASALNDEQDLSGIRVGLHDEIFQGATPVLAGVDARSTYCYLLAAEQHRDADTWGVHLLDAAERGLRPDYTIADAGRGLRAGQEAAWGDTPCHGDVFHTIRTQSPYGMRLLASGVRVRPAQRDDMLDLQSVVVDDDALDHQPQDGLPLGGGLPSAVPSLGQEALIPRRQLRGIPEQARHVLPDGPLQALRLDLRPRALRLAGRRERVHPGAAIVAPAGPAALRSRVAAVDPEAAPAALQQAAQHVVALLVVAERQRGIAC